MMCSCMRHSRKQASYPCRSAACRVRVFTHIRAHLLIQISHAVLALASIFMHARVTERPEAPAAIIVEEDMLFSPDFVRYFEATAPALDEDPTLFGTWQSQHVTSVSITCHRILCLCVFGGISSEGRRSCSCHLNVRKYCNIGRCAFFIKVC
jgi:GNT-I family